MRRFLLILAIIAAGCSRGVPAPHTGDGPGVYPDYRNVTVPGSIAPLNFYYYGNGTEKATTQFTSASANFVVKGSEVCIPGRKWRRLLSGGDVTVSSSLMGEWSIFVSEDPIDEFLTYRLIEPGYEVWDRVCICERSIFGWEERKLADWKNTGNSCMNCHIHKGDNSMFYLRGKKGGAVLNTGGQTRKLALNADGMLSGTVYGDLHPSGRWGVFSSNIIIPGFHSVPGGRLEVYDKASDLCICDFEDNTIDVPARFSRKDVLETFPCFSADGKTVYYCAADSVSLPENIKDLKYALMAAPFDNGELGEPSIIRPASEGSVCHPKCSPDGQWILYTVADYGTFPIWHRECDLEMLNLITGELADMSAVNSPLSDTYHSWASSGRWFVFASKRDDGQYGRPFICHFSEDGKAGRPFVLPQKDPHFYDKTTKSYNIPDFGSFSAPYDYKAISSIREECEAETFTLKRNENS